MKRIIIIFTFIISICLTSCANPNTEDPKEQAAAYYTIFEDLFYTDLALNSDITYIALDLTEVMLADTEPLISLAQNFCDKNRYILILDTFDGLTEKGYIKDLYFENGILITFDDSELTWNRLVTTAKKWRSGTGAIGADYTVKRNSDISPWEISRITNRFVS